MTVYTGTAPGVLAQITADVHQLTRAIHLAHRGRIITQACLLDQLRASIGPAGRCPMEGPSRRRVAESRPPVAAGPMEALSTLYVELAGWHVRLWLASPPYGVDWQKASLRALARYAPELAPSVAEWLSVEVHDWWASAARESGWNLAELLRLR